MESLFYHPTAGSTPLPPELSHAESVWFDSGDGTRLHGWLIRTQAAESAATILHVHGNAGNIEGHRWFTEYLPPAGFNVFIFDYRGYGQSEGRARRRGPLIQDTNAALDMLQSREDIDPQRIGIYGQSLGGSIGLLVMADRPEVQAGVFEAPFTSWRQVAANTVGGDPPNVLGRTLALLISDSDRPIDAIERIDRPVLVIQGTDDAIVPISHGRQLAAAGGDSVRLVELQGGDHNALRETNPEIEKLVIEFFRREL
jgi:hypothetical protein